MKDLIAARIRQSADIKYTIADNKEVLELIEEVAQLIIQTYRNNRKVLFCGNGGSAADAQHLAAELSGKFYIDRPPLFAEALHVNTSYLTAVANDYSFEEIYSRLVRAKGKASDVLIGISTSGNSKNIVRAIDTAREIGLITIGLTGENGGEMASRCDYLIKVPSKDIPRIQEVHILIGHIICELVEQELFGNE